jgi:hypothetical protein
VAEQAVVQPEVPLRRDAGLVCPRSAHRLSSTNIYLKYDCTPLYGIYLLSLAAMRLKIGVQADVCVWL